MTTTPRRLGSAFAFLWCSAVVSSVGDGAFVVAMPLLAAFLTNDPASVALVSAAAGSPWFLVSFWAGALIDRMPRRAVVVVVDLVRAVALGVLAVLIITGHANTIALAVIAFVVVAGRVFFDPAAQALVPHVVGRDSEVLTRANGRLYAGETVGQSLAGPPIGGATFAVAPAAPFIIDAVSFAASAAFLARVPHQPAPKPADGQSVRSAIKEGFAYLFKQRELVLLAATVMAFNLGWNMAAATFVLYAKNSLGASDFAYGLLIAASSIGGIAAGWTASRVVKFVSLRGAALLSMVVQALGWVAIVLTESIWVAGAGYALVGAAATISTVAVVSARQQAVPDHLLGRVVSAFRLLGNGVGPLGAAIGGVLASAFGLTTPFVVAAAMLVLAAAVLAPPLLRSR